MELPPAGIFHCWLIVSRTRILLNLLIHELGPNLTKLECLLGGLIQDLIVVVLPTDDLLGLVKDRSYTNVG